MAKHSLVGVLVILWLNRLKSERPEEGEVSRQSAPSPHAIDYAATDLEEEDAEDSSSPKAFGARARTLWNQYVYELNQEYARNDMVIQEKCKPTLLEQQGKYRGTVILLHGFTACAQQFELVAPTLQARGFVVLMPLLPGHGAEPVAKTVNHGPLWCRHCEKKTTMHDKLDLLPEDYPRYMEFAFKMNNIAEDAGGITSVFGISLGGAVAAFAGAHYQYTYQMIAAPLIRLGTGDAVLNFIDDLTFGGSGEIPIGWGDNCLYERSKGRAGICDFKKENLLAARHLGDYHYKYTNSHLARAGEGGVHYLMVEGDGAVSNTFIRKLAKKTGIGKDSPYACIFDKEVGHSFLSAYDNPDQNKY